ncbi:MAG TPA: histidine phosphatase family protein [Patescibacteria group bacterium]|nr:histidine phosphatase family protein [Patescibacteria group bacterium]
MTVKGTLVILRHGQTDYNVQHLMTGQRDIPLNATGEEQAREAGRVISVFTFDKAFSSNLGRAFNTAAIALESAGNQTHLLKDGKYDVEQRAEIAELDTGDFTGRNHKTDPEIVNYGRRFDKPLPGGESDQQVVDRVQKFFDEQVQPRLACGETVLVVSHSGIMRAFDIVLGFQETPQPDNAGWTTRARVPNATPTVAEYEDGKLVNHYRLVNSKELEAANQNKPLKPPKAGGLAP